ncbi:C-type lectin domain family 2 member D isoform X2 [Diceros bicornis minor]|uniref:C-type lectin domain family 2 member D isoform X2 n=1 Tax=Diceros bicornis minor TaxID=77932 RepID=UPI0026ED9FC9|nr:C-type lectin domain family 2 member D isoform X2 [Diceros bicornis minor]
MKTEGKMYNTNNVEQDFIPGYLPSKKHSSKVIPNLLLVLVMCLIIACGATTALLVTRTICNEKPSECLEAACPESWIGFQRKCFYFSDDTKNWTFSQRFCDSQGANLVQVETLQELEFLLRYKGPSDHWIGLSREQGQSWKWTDGTEWTRCFPITGGGECAYLNDKGASSARRYTERKWICSKPDTYAQMRSQSPN